MKANEKQLISIITLSSPLTVLAGSCKNPCRTQRTDQQYVFNVNFVKKCLENDIMPMISWVQKYALVLQGWVLVLKYQNMEMGVLCIARLSSKLWLNFVNKGSKWWVLILNFAWGMLAFDLSMILKIFLSLKFHLKKKSQRGIDLGGKKKKTSDLLKSLSFLG